MSRSSRIRRHLTFANTASALALFFAIGGGTAAIALQGKNKVDSGDIKNKAVKTKDLANNAATGAKVNEPTFDTVPNSDELDGISSELFQIGNGVSGAIAGGVPDNAQTGRIDLGTVILELECNGTDLLVNVQDDAGAPTPSVATPTDVWINGEHTQFTTEGATTAQETFDIAATPGITVPVQYWDAIGVVAGAQLSAFQDTTPNPDQCQVVLPIQQNFDGGSPVNSSVRKSAVVDPSATTGLLGR